MERCEDNLRFRQITDALAAVQIVRGKVLRMIHKFFLEKDFTLVDPPIMHERITNKKHEIYLPLYDGRYSLNSSNALYMAACAALFGKVYAISPTFRDEQDSVNHLVEFRMLEVEMPGVCYRELPDFVEAILIFLLNELSTLPEIRRLPLLWRRMETLLESFPFQRVPYEDFVRELGRAGGRKIRSGLDLSEIDYMVSAYIDSPVFVMDYPRSLASWTAKRQGDAGACALNLILPETYGELCEGCERTSDVALLRRKIEGVGIDNLQWYLAAVERIHAPRCGFGIGVDRLVRWITGSAHIRDTVLFPRMKLR